MQLLIVEDDIGLNKTIQMYYEEQGYDVCGKTNLSDALEHVQNFLPDMILLDQQLPDGHGIDFLQQIKSKFPYITIIMMTGVHNLDLAIKAIKLGAFDFIHKPIKLDALNHTVNRAIEHFRLRRQVEALQHKEKSDHSSGHLVGRSEAMLKVSKEIAIVADSDVRVLITGETGTGKEIVARAIHQYSQRKGVFLVVNCAAIVDTLMESELFGHEKGAFTGAHSRKLGKFELASDGTLFLDEIGELSLPLQAKLLRVLQESSFERVGGAQQLSTNGRIIAATNRDLEEEVRQGKFREDLLYRLKIMHIRLPALRERKDDIPILAIALLQKMANAMHKPIPTLSQEAVEHLSQYSWPGNVRELENSLTQALIRGRGQSMLSAEYFSLPHKGVLQKSVASSPKLVSLAELESEHIQLVMEATSFHKGKSCEILQISRPALDRKIVKYGLVLEKCSP